MILWEGPSILTGEPIVAILSYGRSRNHGTGDMAQLWVLHQEVPPHEAFKGGQGDAVCGECPFRDGTCYVRWHQAPNGVWRAYRRGSYELWAGDFWPDKPTRFGAAGDVAAIPRHVAEPWFYLARANGGWTCYTHQWHRKDAQWLKPWSMASLPHQTLDRGDAERMGWRTYRARWDSTIHDDEIQCPKAEEYKLRTGKQIQCVDCLLCNGSHERSSTKNVVILEH